MSYINKVILIGYVTGKSIFYKHSEGEHTIILTISTSERWTDKKSNRMQEHTEFHCVYLHKKLAELVNRYIDIGHQVYIEGQLRTRTIKGTDNQKIYETDILVSGSQGTIQLLSRN